MSDITVRKVESKADNKVFFEFPWELYKGSPYWVPPLKSTRRDTLDREKDPSWQYMEGEYYIAWRGDVAVGTIAAFVNKRHNETWNENIAWFGAFDFIDDPEVARLLLETAENWARERGYDAVRGPATFTLHSEVGVLMRPYDQPPLILMPYNYDYYPKHIEAAGYLKEKDLGTWCMDWEDMQASSGSRRTMERTRRLGERAMKTSNITWRNGDPRNKKGDYELIREIYNDGWEDNWGFVPLTDAEFAGLVDELALVYEPKWAGYVFVDGDPAAFFVGTPDINQAVHKAYPKPSEPEIFTLLKVLWHWKLRPKVDTLRFALGGIKRKYHGSRALMGIATAFFDTFFDNDHWRHYDGGWVLEDNENMNSLLRSYTAKECRLYRVYQKNL